MWWIVNGSCNEMLFVLREGYGKKLSELYTSMFDLYHGNNTSSIPSHIKLLCNASFCFNALYDKKQKQQQIRTVSPSDWIFPSFFSFIWFGPFVNKESCLPLLEITDAHKDAGKSWAKKRKGDKLEKDIHCQNDTSNERGFSTDQKSQLKLINIQKRKEDDCTRETILVGLNKHQYQYHYYHCCYNVVSTLLLMILITEMIAFIFSNNSIKFQKNTTFPWGTILYEEAQLWLSKPVSMKLPSLLWRQHPRSKWHPLICL